MINCPPISAFAYPCKSTLISKVIQKKNRHFVITEQSDLGKFSCNINVINKRNYIKRDKFMTHKNNCSQVPSRSLNDQCMYDFFYCQQMNITQDDSTALDEKMDLHKLFPRKYVANLQKLTSKSGAKMVNATFAQLFTPPVFWYANVAFTIFAPYLLLCFYKFATYL